MNPVVVDGVRQKTCLTRCHQVGRRRSHRRGMNAQTLDRIAPPSIRSDNAVPVPMSVSYRPMFVNDGPVRIKRWSLAAKMPLMRAEQKPIDMTALVSAKRMSLLV